MKLSTSVRAQTIVVVIAVMAAGCTSAAVETPAAAERREEVPTEAPAAIAGTPVAEDAEPRREVPSSVPEPLSVDRTPSAPYLPTWLPESYELESITWLDGPPELQTADAIAGQTLMLGDSAIVSDLSVTITARRFSTADELEHAVWVEDAMMVQSGGPDSSVSVEGTVFAFDEFPGPTPDSHVVQFHAVVDGVLVTGLIFGAMSMEDRAQLVSSIVFDDALNLDVAGEDLGLVELDRAAPLDDQEPGFELLYSNGSERFSVMTIPGASEATVAFGSMSRAGDRFQGENGSGFIEAQPEVGGALGSRRLIWWVPEVRLQVWFGNSLDDEQAVKVADSVELVDANQWEATVMGVGVERMDFGPLNLPEDPGQVFEDRLADQNREAGEIGERPDLDLIDITNFVAEMRGGELAADVDVEWLTPTEADLATSGMNLLPQHLRQVLLGLRLARASDDSAALADSRRRAVRGLCCSASGIQLVEGMQPDEAAVVASHEITHLYDTTAVNATYAASAELLDASAALREGNATRVMVAYRDARDLRFNIENNPNPELSAALAMRRILRFAYQDGRAFTEAVAAAGGEQAIDAAFVDNPPRSTEHILHPDHYLAGDLPQTVAAPEAPAGVLVDQRSTLGAFIIALAAEEALGWEAAVELAGAWSGDGFVAWSEDGRRCVAANVKFDDSGSASDFVAAAGGVATGSLVALESCSL